MSTLGQHVLEVIKQRYGKRLSTVAKHLDTTEDKVLHLGLDPAFAPDGYADLPEMLRVIIKNPLTEASCYPTAEHLFPVIADQSSIAQGGSAPKERFTDASTVREAVAGLVKALTQAVDNKKNVVFRVELAGHGFTLVVRTPDADSAPQVELIETIANGSLITPSLVRKPLSPATVTAALGQMVDDNMETRKKGAQVLDWDATDFWLAEKKDNDPVFPHIGFRWWSGALRADAVDRWVEQFGQRLTVFEKLADQ